MITKALRAYGRVKPCYELLFWLAVLLALPFITRAMVALDFIRMVKP